MYPGHSGSRSPAVPKACEFAGIGVKAAATANPRSLYLCEMLSKFIAVYFTAKIAYFGETSKLKQFKLRPISQNSARTQAFCTENEYEYYRSQKVGGAILYGFGELCVNVCKIFKLIEQNDIARCSINIQLNPKLHKILLPCLSLLFPPAVHEPVSKGIACSSFKF